MGSPKSLSNLQNFNQNPQQEEKSLDTNSPGESVENSKHKRPATTKKNTSNSILQIKKKTVQARPTVNIDLTPPVSGITITINGKDKTIDDMILSQELPPLLQQVNQLEIFKDGNIKQSELVRILIAIGVTFLKEGIGE